MPWPGHHPVDRARLDPLIGAEAVAVMHGAAIEIGDRGQPDMRMRADIDPLPGHELRRAHLVEEDERPDHLALRRGQRAAHLEPAQIAGARDDQRFDRIDGVAGRAIGSSAGFQLMAGPFICRCQRHRRWRANAPAAASHRGCALVGDDGFEPPTSSV
jgi:hypothetical protein